MGVAVSSPLAKRSDVKNGIQSVTVKSIHFDEDEAKTLVRSISYNSLDPEPLILISVGSKNMVSEGSVSFKGLDLEQSVSAKSPPLDKPENVPIKAVIETPKQSPVFDPSNPQHEAAIRLQKVYKSFRTRRKLADCAIDPRHRYGHNLHFYYNQWLHSQSKEPFFYWLDIGEGKEVNIEKCPRSKLQLQCIKYLSPIERKPYEVMVVNGKFVYKQTGKPVHTNEETGDAKWIFVLSTSKILYVGVKKKGTFQHSSFLAGGATIAAGRLVVDNGILKAVWPHSGHYRPLEENFNDFISFLRENNVDLNNVKMTPVDEEGNLANKQRNSNHFRCNSSEDDFNFEANEINAKDSIDQIR
ncbi:Alpha-latrocrustotoxin-Lt1a [Gossypium arboreum]|uniref:Alpha-latrocrustotoxin-Lt1a n=1 Tax=Gossypium arboreum TaxID=29729 RepID=A0A0B0PJY2_GOSAR|nr:Alpha-latrocrustotoxin-Lt1a [Gossypium arboreum]